MARFHVYALNWNEERLLPAFFKHYEQADKIFILDNYSTDKSHDIIRAHGGEIILFDSNNTLLDAENSRQKNKVWKSSRGSADFVVVQDLDEFLYFPEYPNDLRAGLTALAKKGVTVIKTRGCQMFCTDEEFDRYSKYQGGQSIASLLFGGTIHHPIGDYDKCIAFDPNKIIESNYNAGAHVMSPIGDVLIDTRSTLLLHYKFIGLSYLCKRYAEIRDRMSTENIVRHWGRQYMKSDKEIEAYLQEFYTKYLKESVFRIMYPSPTVAAIDYRGRKCVLDTYGQGDYVSRMLLQGAIWEPNVAELIYSLCSVPNTAFLDIGANIGAHTAIAALAGASRIHSFECNPPTFKKLERSVQMNGWTTVKLWNLAASDKEGYVPFTVVPDNIGASYIPETHKGWPGATTPAEKGVRTATLDSLFIDLSGSDSVVIKMDVEGHELQALHGMRTLLSNVKVKHLILEINPVCVEADVIKEELELLRAAGFRHSYLVFQVPGNEWAGPALSSLHSLKKVDDTAILELFDSKHVTEIYFTK